MLAFLSCIETGLLPHGRLDPPVWSQRSSTSNIKRRRPLPALSETEDITKDFVFRIVNNSSHKELRKNHKISISCFLRLKIVTIFFSSNSLVTYHLN